MKNTILFLFLLFTFQVYSNDIVNISSDMYNIDEKNKLIVVNENVDEVNAEWAQEKDSISMGDVIYTINSPVENFVIGQAYKVTANNTTYKLYFTELPIVKLTVANAGSINLNTKLPGTFSIVDSTKTKTTSTIGIRLRGASSSGYPKKHYRIEFWTDEAGSTTKDISLLGMRSDDDWNLMAMYNEPLKIRNKTTFDIWRSINKLHYQSSEPDAINSARLKYVEVFLNNEYKGVYCVGEPVDRKQLQLKKYDETTGIRGELYKGITWDAPVMLNSLPSYTQGRTTWGGFEYKYPEEISPDWKNLYDFVYFVVRSSDANFYVEHKSKFDFDNIVDYFIFLNLTRATDNTGKNIFIAKYKEDAPYFYVPWDLDGVFGTIWTGDRQNITTDILVNNFFTRLLKSYQGNDFKKKVKQRWNQLVAEGLTADNLIAQFQANHDYLYQNGVYEREYAVWPAKYTYPSDHLSYLSTWIRNRYTYLNTTFNNYASYSENTVNVYVNEISGNGKWLEIYNAENNEIDLSGYIIQKIDEDGIIANWKIPSNTKIAAGGFLHWTQNKDCTDSSTFTWGISAKKDVAFKIFDLDNNEIDYFEVKMPNLYSEGNNRTVGRKTDGADELVIFLNNGTKGTSNNEATIQIPTVNPKKIYINEISGNEKWLEIYNAEDAEVDLTGYYIQKIDEDGKTENWLIPAETIINANGFLSWTQNEENTDGATFTWGISAKKDVAFKIFDNNGTELDYFEIRENLYSDGDNKTVGRKKDGGNQLIVFSTGTKEFSNSNGVPLIAEIPKNIYINEISGNEKWMEIYNAEEEEVDVSDYIIQKIDEDGISVNWPIPAETKIAAGGFLYWTQNSNCTDGSTFTWGISAKKDVAFKIIDLDNNELDFFEVKMPAMNSEGIFRTVGRKTDGADELVIFLNGGTKGTSNNDGREQIPSENPKKIYVNEISGNEKWLEIYNAENDAIDLSDYIIQKIDEESKTSNWVIPNGTNIEPKGFLFWTQDAENTDGSTFTWGISAKKDVAFKLFDNNGTELDYFEVKMPAMNSEGNNRTVGRETDGADELIIFEKGTPGASNKNFSNALSIQGNERYKIHSNILVILDDISLVIITNYSGKIILQQEVSKNATINLNDLPLGVYILQLQSKRKTEMIKFAR